MLLIFYIYIILYIYLVVMLIGFYLVTCKPYFLLLCSSNDIYYPIMTYFSYIELLLNSLRVLLIITSCYLINNSLLSISVITIMLNFMKLQFLYVTHWPTNCSYEKSDPSSWLFQTVKISYDSKYIIFKTPASVSKRNQPKI